MNEQQIKAMTQHYNDKYGKPANDKEAIYKLIAAYKDLFGEIPTQVVKEGIGEYYRIISNRDLPAYLWIMESLHVTYKKEKDKQTFPYCVGMLRTWLKYGFGHIPNQEEAEIVDYFEEVTGTEATSDARQLLQTLMGKYGLIKVTRMINDLAGADKALLFMTQLQSMMTDKFDKAK